MRHRYDIPVQFIGRQSTLMFGLVFTEWLILAGAALMARFVSSHLAIGVALLLFVAFKWRIEGVPAFYVALDALLYAVRAAQRRPVIVGSAHTQETTEQPLAFYQGADGAIYWEEPIQPVDPQEVADRADRLVA